MQTDYVVGDLMTIDPVVIAPTAPLEAAARMLEAFDVSGLPVVDEDGRLVGVISQTDLLRGTAATKGPASKSLAGRHVADLMSAPPVTVSITTRLCDAARLMRDRGIHRLVVVNGADLPVGVLSSMDFVTLYAEG